MEIAFDSRPASREDFEKLLGRVSGTNANATAAVGDIWETPVIDYFSDLRLLLNGSGSVDFQRATQALFMSTLVYSKKIDVAAQDTAKLISMLAISKRSRKGDKENGDSDDEGSDEEYNPSGSSKKSRRVAKEIDPYTYALVNLKKIQLVDNTIFEMRDPVFMKFISAFDEGGPKALLNNTLRIDYQGLVCMDDVTTRLSVVDQSHINEDISPKLSIEEDTDEGEENDEDTHMSLNQNGYSTDDYISDELINSLNEWKSTFDITALQNLHLCADISNIERAMVDEEYGQEFIKRSLDKDDLDQKLFELEQRVAEHSLYADQDHMMSIDFDNGHDGDGSRGFESEISNFDSMEQEKPKKVLTKEERALYDLKRLEMMKSLDDRLTNKRKSTWKIQYMKSIKRTKHIIEDTPNSSDNNTNNNNNRDGDGDDDKFEDDGDNNYESNELKATAYKKKQSKQRYIDFTQEPEPDLFRRGTKLTKQLQERTTLMDDQILWSSLKMVKSFLNPRRTFKGMFDMDREVDEEFWAREVDEDDDTNHFFHTIDDIKVDNSNVSDDGNDDDNLDVPGAISGYEFDVPLANSSFAEMEEEVHTPVASQSASLFQRRNSNSIQYSGRSKIVDVRLLKTNLLNAIRSSKTEPVSNIINESGEENHQKRKVATKLKLSEVVSKTSENYKGPQKDDLSTSFYFICMLHLANEQGFAIESIDNGNDVLITGSEIID